MSPSLVADGTGQLHLIFSNEFGFNYEIFYVVRRDGEWQWPINVSRTTGKSSQPVLVITESGKLAAAWTDDTPGYPTIYFGSWSDTFWSAEPVANARGQAPALAAAPDGTLFLAWQNDDPEQPEDPATFQIFLSELPEPWEPLTKLHWSLPVILSDHPNVDAIGATMGVARGTVHVVWVENDQEVIHTYGRDELWSEPQSVSAAADIARGPRLVVEQGSMLYLVWDEGDAIISTTAAALGGTWSSPAVVTNSAANLRDVATSLVPTGGIGASWVQVAGPGDVAVYESQRKSVFARQVWLPVLLHN